MRVILAADVKKVGQRGQLVEVADGYALNVLIPQRKAVPATPENLRRHQQGLAEAKQRADASAKQSKALLAALDGKTLTISAKAGPTGTLFKSIHAEDIASEIKKQWGIDLPALALMIVHPIKQKGTHQVPIELLGSKASVSVALI